MPELAPNEKAAVAATEESNSFQSILKSKARLTETVEPLRDTLPPDEMQRLEAGVLSFIEELVRRDPANVGRDALRTLDAMIDQIDSTLEKGVNAVMHHENFQKVESTWRGLHYMVSRTLTGKDMKIKVMDLSKDELSDMMQEYEGVVFHQSPLYKKIHDRGVGSANGEIFGCLTGDYYFGASPRDVMTLKGISKIAAAAHCPFIAGADPTVFGIKSWTKINDAPQLQPLVSGPAYAPWNSLRESEDARFIGLAMPRFITRYPYGPDTTPVKEFNFVEDTAAGDHGKYLWSNSAYAMAAAINRAFVFDGYCGRIRGYNAGGRVRGLPTHTFKSSKGILQTKCPAEVEIPKYREAELAGLGFMPLIHFEGTDDAVFIGAQSLQAPKEYEGPDGKPATANAALSARLPYIFVTCRIAHYLQRILYKKVGDYADKTELSTYLNNWMNNTLIETNPDAGQEERAKRPLRAAAVTVYEDEARPGYFGVTFELCPHIQVEGVSVMLKLVARLPKTS